MLLTRIFFMNDSNHKTLWIHQTIRQIELIIFQPLPFRKLFIVHSVENMKVMSSGGRNCFFTRNWTHKLSVNQSYSLPGNITFTVLTDKLKIMTEAEKDLP